MDFRVFYVNKKIHKSALQPADIMTDKFIFNKLYVGTLIIIFGSLVFLILDIVCSALCSSEKSGEVIKINKKTNKNPR